MTLVIELEKKPGKKDRKIYLIRCDRDGKVLFRSYKRKEAFEFMKTVKGKVTA